MASWKCGNCGLFNFAESTDCRRCGAAMSGGTANGYAMPQAQPPNPYAQPPANQAPYHTSYGEPQSYGQQGYGQQGFPLQQGNTNPLSQSQPPSHWQPPQPDQWNNGQHWTQPQAQQHHQGPQPNWHYPSQPPVNGFAPQGQPHGWQQASGYAQPVNPAQSPMTDYSQAPSYGAPAAASYQPNSWQQGGVWRDGDKLVMHRHAKLPDRCVKCDLPTNGSYLHRKLSWINPLWVLTILASWIIYLIIYYALRKTAEVDLGLCEAHKASRRTGITVGWVVALLGIGAFIFAIVGEALAFLFFGILLFIGGLIYGSYAAAVVSVTKMDDQYIWMKRVSKDYLAGLPPAGGF